MGRTMLSPSRSEHKLISSALTLELKELTMRFRQGRYKQAQRFDYLLRALSESGWYIRAESDQIRQ